MRTKTTACRVGTPRYKAQTIASRLGLSVALVPDYMHYVQIKAGKESLRLRHMTNFSQALKELERIEGLLADYNNALR